MQENASIRCRRFPSLLNVAAKKDHKFSDLTFYRHFMQLVKNASFLTNCMKLMMIFMLTKTSTNVKRLSHRKTNAIMLTIYSGEAEIVAFKHICVIKKYV